MPKSLMLVYSDPVSPEQEAEYNRWYTDKHLGDVVGVDGIVSATRYRLDKGVSIMGGLPTNATRYLAVYELEAETTEEMQAICDRMAAGIEAGTVDVSPALDGERLTVDFAVAVSDKVT